LLARSFILETATTESTGKKLTDMQKRVITAAVYLVVWVALCALKWLVPDNWGAFGFDAVFCAVSVIGSYEFLRAIDRTALPEHKISTPQRAFAIAFCAMVVPLYVCIQLTMNAGFLAVACAFTVYVMFLCAISVFDHGRSTVKGTINCIFCMLYCGVLSAILSSINHLVRNSMVAILLLFMSTVLTDTGAFVIGSIFKKWIPAKLAPRLSPNKTVIGAVGGILGGIAGALLAYAVIYFLGGGINGTEFAMGVNGVFLTFSSDKIHPIVTFILVGFFTSVTAQIGDLFESAIKRECGVKDMGKLLPGHGGILDRFDSMLYCSTVVLLCFGTIIV